MIVMSTLACWEEDGYVHKQATKMDERNVEYILAQDPQKSEFEAL